MKREEKELYIKHKLGLIKELMEEKGIKYANIEKGIGYHTETISKYVRGIYPASIKAIDLIYDYCYNAEDTLGYTKNIKRDINKLILDKSIKLTEIGKELNLNVSNISKTLNGYKGSSIEGLNKIYEYCNNYVSKFRKLSNKKTYIIVTNDKFELIVALGTLEDICEDYGFSEDMLLSAVRYNREVIYKKKYKLIEYDLEQLDKENLE
jgi:transcriptional regulator with XRE-family HTH domain